MTQKGDADAFDSLFELYKDEAVRTAYLITGNQSICEDIAQEAFLTCYRCIGSLKKPETFRAWFYRILTRSAWKYGKRARREVAEENVEERADKIDRELSSERYRQSEVNESLYLEISRLEPKQKAAVILYYFSGLSTKEISMTLHCLEGTVKSRLHAARKKLKRNLKASESEEKESGSVARKGIA